MRERIGVVFAALAARERKELDEHGEQRRKLVTRSGRMHEHVAFQDALAHLRRTHTLLVK